MQHDKNAGKNTLLQKQFVQLLFLKLGHKMLVIFDDILTQLRSFFLLCFDPYIHL
jgi:hypothetical protein